MTASSRPLESKSPDTISLLHPERSATTAVFLVNGLGIGAWAAAIPHFSAELGLTHGQLSLVVFSFAVGAVTAMPLAGTVGSRVATGPATCAAGLAFTLALILPAFAPSLALLCTAAIVVGAGNGAVDVLMNAHASGIERRAGRPIMSSFHAAFSLGGVFGAALGGVLGMSYFFAGLWVPATLGTLLISFAAWPLRGKGAVAKPVPLAMPSRALIALCVLALLCMMIEGAVVDWSGTYLAQASVSPTLVFTGYAAFSISMVVGRVVGDRLVTKLGPAGAVRGGGLLAMIGLALVVALPGLASGIIGFALVGLGLANVVPVAFSAAARTGASATAGVAMAATAGYAGFLLGPVLIGVVASFEGLRWGMGVLVVASMVVAALSAARQLQR